VCGDVTITISVFVVDKNGTLLQLTNTDQLYFTPISGYLVLRRSLSLLLTKAARVITKKYQREFIPLGITVPQATVLGALFAKSPMTQSIIGTINLMDKATLSTAIRQLRDKKLIETTGLAHDARFALHTLTAIGNTRAEQIVQIENKVKVELEQMASPEIIEQVHAYLAAILQAEREDLD